MKKITSFLFSFILLSTLFFGLNTIPINAVELDGFIVYENWNGFNVGVTSGTGTYATWERESGNNFEISSVLVDSGNSLLLTDDSTDDIGWLNVTNKYDYIGTMEFYIRVNVIAGSHYFRFYNNSVLTMTILLDSINHDIETYCVGVGYQQIYDGTDLTSDSTNGIYRVKIAHVTGNTMNYYVYSGDNTLLGYLQTASQVATNWVTFDDLKIITDGLSETYFDTMYLNSANEEGTGCADYSLYYSTGEGFLDYDYTFHVKNKYVEFGTFYPINATFNAIELLVDWRQYEADSNINNYYCWFNDNFVGTATCMYPYLSNYIMQFNFSFPVEVDNERLVVELYHTQSDTYNTYWYLKTENLNNLIGPLQYSKMFFSHDDSDLIDGVLNWEFSERHSPKWKAYFDVSTFTGAGEENPNYTNQIILSGFSPDHPTYNVPFTEMYNTVFFLVYVNQTLNPYWLHLYCEGVEVGQEQIYPRRLNNYRETFGYAPLISGNYTVTMETTTGTEYVNHSFYVDINNPLYAIWTSPNPSFGGTSYTVNTIVDDTFIYPMYLIGFFYQTQNTNNINNAFDMVLRQNNTENESFLFAHNNEWGDKHLLRLFGYVDNDVWIPIGPTHTHYILSEIGKEEYISVSNQYPLEEEEFNIYGYHGYIQEYVRVRIGSTTIADVSADNTFIFPYILNDEGTYVITLEVLLNETWLTIDTVTVYVAIDEEDEGDTFTAIFDVIPVWIKAIVGGIITILFIFLPFLMIQYLEKINFKIDVPPVTYALSGCVGMAICWSIGLFGIEILFFVTVIAIVSLLITYLWGQKNNG